MVRVPCGPSRLRRGGGCHPRCASGAVIPGASVFDPIAGEMLPDRTIVIEAERKVLVDPTLVVFRNLILLSDDPAIVGHADNARVPRRQGLLKDREPH